MRHERMMSILLTVERALCVFTLFECFLLALSIHPNDRDDVFDRFMLNNKEQCRRLCWYTRMCTSYSFHTIPISSTAPRKYECILHQETGEDFSPYTAAGWVQGPASRAQITNGCRPRPCAKLDTCVPTSSSAGDRYSCLVQSEMQKARCGDPVGKPPNGTISVVGNSVGDVALLTCDNGYVESPKGAKIVCKRSSRWTKLRAKCKRFEFYGNETGKVNYRLPWRLEQTDVCMKGVFNVSAAFSVIGYKTKDKVKLWLRKKTKWMALRNLTAIKEHSVGDCPFTDGEKFSLTVRILDNTLQFAFKDAPTFNISLDDLADDYGYQIDFRRSVHVRMSGKSRLTYLNKIAAC